MWKLIRHLIKSYEHKTLILCLMFWLSVANVAVPVMFGNLVELLQGGNTGALTMLRSPWMVLAVLAICSLFQWVAGYWVAVLRLKSGTILESRLRKTAWSHLNGVGLAEMYMRPPGEWVQRICGDTALVGGAFQSVVFSIWGFGTFFALTGMAVCRKVPMATAVLATSVFMAVSLHFIFRKRLSRRAMYLRKGSYHFNSFAYDMILMQPMLRMFKAVPVFTSMFCSKSDRFAMRRIGCDAYSIKYNAALQFEVLFWDVVVLCGCVGLFGCGKIGVAELISYHLLTTQLVGGVGGIMQSMPQIIQGYETAKTIAPMFDTPSCSQNKREQHESEVESAAEIIIELKDVSFRYPGTTAPILQHVSVKLAKGQNVVFLGRNGSGKTTLLNIMLGVFGVEGGQIVNRARRMSVVPQKIGLFHGSVFENVRLFSPEISRKDVLHALDACGLGQWVSRLPHREMTPINQDSISGGELQRLGIARAIIRSPDILVVDEITNNLDVVEKLRIEKIIAGYAAKGCVVSVTHDIDAIDDADRIFLLADGGISEIVAGTDDDRSILARRLLLAGYTTTKGKTE